MKWIDNLKTGVKLFGSFGAVVLLMIVIAVIGFTGMNNINNGMTDLYVNRTLPIEQVGAANVALYTVRGDLYRYVVIAEERAKTREAILAQQQIIKEQMDQYRATQLVKDEQVVLAEFDQA